jgi:hypothetical protein
LEERSMTATAPRDTHASFCSVRWHAAESKTDLQDA